MMKILTDKQYKSYNKVSRYQIFPIYYNNIDEKYIYGLTANLSIEDTQFVMHKVRPNDSLDSLALYYYGNPTYYWVIADFNRFRDPYAPLPVGNAIKIPTFSNIKFER